MSGESRRKPGFRPGRRELLVVGCQLLLAGGLVARASDLQLRRSSDLREVSAANSVRTRLLAPARGDIQDRAGHVLANSRPIYSILLRVDDTPDADRLLRRLSQISPLHREDRRRVLHEIDNDSTLGEIVVIADVDENTISRIAANAPGLPGIAIRQRWVRNYPFGSVFSHALGYVGRVSESDVTGNPALARLANHPDFRIGRRGVELRQNALLSGAPGLLAVEVNGKGVLQRELRRLEPVRGSGVRLTLDVGLQSYARQRFGGETGAAVVMDIHSGEVLCLCSTPGFDPNAFTDGISERDWSAIRDHPERPLIDRSVAGTYPPGSTFKMVVALACLERGVRDMSALTHCSGRQQLGDRDFHCWKRGGHGQTGLRRAIRESCDVYFYNAGEAVGMAAVADMGRRLGLGVPHDVGTGAPNEGNLPDADWKRAAHGSAWTRGDSFNAAIGQGFVLASPLQLAVMTARIANGSWRVEPRLDALGDGETPPEFAPLEVNPRHLEHVREAMFAVCNERQGTAYQARISDPSLAMAGKTGTSQVRAIQRDGRGRPLDQAEVERRSRHHALFVGYAPWNRPRFAVSVVVEHGMSGGRAAAPIARDLLLHAQRGARPGILSTGGAGRDGPDHA